MSFQFLISLTTLCGLPDFDDIVSDSFWKALFSLYMLFL